jgi:hypothetical protein
VDAVVLQAELEKVLERPIAGLYVDDDQGVMVRVNISDVAFLHELGDRVLTGALQKDLTTALETQGQLGAGWAVKVDFTQFAEIYESSILRLEHLTPHQKGRLEVCLKNHEHDVHLKAPAGAGKTFVALHIMLDLLERNGAACVLFAARNEALPYFVAAWLAKRIDGGAERGGWLKRESALRRLHVLFHPFSTPCSVRLEGERMVRQPCERYSHYDLVVIDEAHHVYGGDIDDIRIVEAFITPEKSRRLLLSDASQAADPSVAKNYPEVQCEVELTEVVRSSKRIVAGAMHFQTGAKGALQCHHDSAGPPLKSFLFSIEAPFSTKFWADSMKYHQYAEQTVQAVGHIMNQFPGLQVHHRLAILVPDKPFLAAFTEPLTHALRRSNPNWKLVGAIQSVSAGITSVIVADAVGGCEHGALAEVVFDTVDNFDGLERLIVIAVGLDSTIEQSGSLKTSSRLYRAITRAHMMVVVVNELLRGGWLEWLTRVELDKTSDMVVFDMKAELRHFKPGEILRAASMATVRILLEKKDATDALDLFTKSQNFVKPKIIRMPASQRHLLDGQLPTSLVLQGTWDTSNNTAKCEDHELAFMPFETDGDAKAAQSILRQHFRVGRATLGGAELLVRDRGMFGDEEAAAIAGGLPRYMNLHSLNVRHCNIGDAGALAVASVLPQCTQLRNLSVSGNVIGDVGAGAIATALPRCLALCWFDIDHNRIGEVGAEKLADALPLCAQLEKCFARGNQWGSRGKLLLGTALPSGGASLYLDDDELYSDGEFSNEDDDPEDMLNTEGFPSTVGGAPTSSVAQAPLTRTDLKSHPIFENGRPPEFDAATGAPTNVAGMTQLVQEWATPVTEGDKPRVVELSYGVLAHATQSFSRARLYNEVWGGQSGGTIFKGTLFGVDVLVKRVQNSEGEVKMFEAERELLLHMSHPNIARLLAFSSDGQPCSVIELCTGGALDNRLKNLPSLTWQHRLRIACGVAKALGYIHGRGMVHRDVKSSIVVLDDSGEAKLASFGAVRAGVHAGAGKSHVSTRMVVGTPGYMPQEYEFDGQVSEKTDSYAFAVLLLELLTGKVSHVVVRRYHEEESFLEQMHQFIDSKAGAWPSAVVEGLAEISGSCIEFHAPQRLTIRDVLPRLEALGSSRFRSTGVMQSSRLGGGERGAGAGAEARAGAGAWEEAVEVEVMEGGDEEKEQEEKEEEAGSALTAAEATAARRHRPGEGGAGYNNTRRVLVADVSNRDVGLMDSSRFDPKTGRPLAGAGAVITKEPVENDGQGRILTSGPVAPTTKRGGAHDGEILTSGPVAPTDISSMSPVVGSAEFIAGKPIHFQIPAGAPRFDPKTGQPMHSERRVGQFRAVSGFDPKTGKPFRK